MRLILKSSLLIGGGFGYKFCLQNSMLVPVTQKCVHYPSPHKNNSLQAYIFFYIFIIIGSFFILNLIVGVIIESFQQLSKSANMSAIEAIMTEDQRKFVTAVRALFSARPKKICPKPESYFRKQAWMFVLHPWFEFTIFIVIMLNMFLLGVGGWNC